VRILHVNKFLYRRGGAESYLLDLADLQRSAGHEIAFLSTAHPSNEPSLYADLFPRYVELNPPPSGLRAKAQTVARMLYSRAAERAMEAIISDFRPHIVHLHNIYHHLSPSILRPLVRRRIPSVMTLHDFKLACPTHRFLASGEPCEACLGRRFHHAILKRCNDGSIGASAANAVELAIHTATGAYEPIRIFICPSRFLLGKMRAAGVFPTRLRWVPNFVRATAMRPKRRPGGPALYAGRLSPEKGVDVLVRAAAAAGVPLEVIGDGPERERLAALADALGASRTRFLGHRTAAEVHERMRNASVTVMPSRGYENMPMAVLESFACGVPVIGAGHGGIPELIRPGVDGDLFPPGDHAALAEVLAHLTGDPDRALEMGRQARRKVEEDFSAERHLALLDAAYAEAMAATRR
jgi:glycosyltransferase involved in cell wall biosynthesis